VSSSRGRRQCSWLSRRCETYFRLDRRQRELIADIVREGQAAGDFDWAADPADFALALIGLMDGLGVQVTLGQPGVSADRMIERWLAMASAELGCELEASGPVVRRGARR
jgi:BetI-type transcriptional repressor, C-terminal